MAADIQVQFTMAADAANRAVMADTDEASKDAAQAAMKAREQVEHDLAALEPVLKGLGYADDSQKLDMFKRQFDEYKKLDDETLNLAVENTNLKAQRLSFTDAQAAADDFRKALESLAKLAKPRDRTHVEALSAQALNAVMSIQVIQARHIAESNDQAMMTMEEQMSAADAAARKMLAELKSAVPAAGASSIADATAALDRFKAVDAQIIQLSRRNTNVRSLALSLGEKHTAATKCQAALQALNDSLAQHEFKATR